MKKLYELGLLLFVGYLLTSNIFQDDEGGNKTLIYVFAAGALTIMWLYVIYYALSRYSMFRCWPFSTIWLALMCMAVFYALLAQYEWPSVYANVSVRNMAIILLTLVTSLFVYTGIKRGHMTNMKLDFLIIALFLVGLYNVYNAVMYPITRLGEDLVNTSSGYVFLLMMPLLVYKYKRHGLWLFIITFLLTSITGKRGALVTYVVLLIYYVWHVRIWKRNLVFGPSTIVYMSLVVLVLGVFLVYGYDSLMFRLMNIVHPEKGTIGSGRDVIWGALFEHWLNSDTTHMLIGNGFFSTMGILDNVAHNDIIQYLVDYGLLGLILYIIFLVRLYKDIRPIKHYNQYLYMVIIFAFIGHIGRALFAGTLRADHVYWSVAIGYLLAQASQYKKTKKETLI